MTTAPAPSTTVKKVALIGNPNTGKSTLFNALAGLNARTGNYPGVTVEKKIGRVTWDQLEIDLIDLPGTYSLSPRTPDEMVSVDVLSGHSSSVGQIDAVICIADATNLERNLYLVSQILDMGLPTVLVLNMWDALKSRKLEIDLEQLRKNLKIPVITSVARSMKGVEELRKETVKLIQQESVPEPLNVFPPVFNEACNSLKSKLDAWNLSDLDAYEVERLLLDVNGSVEKRCTEKAGSSLTTYLKQVRDELSQKNCPIPRIESECRYRWAKEKMEGVQNQNSSIKPRSKSDMIDRWLTHNWAGLIFFMALMLLICQTIITWADPVMGYCETGQEAVAGLVESLIGPGTLRSLLVRWGDRLSGGVLIFLRRLSFCSCSSPLWKIAVTCPARR